MLISALHLNALMTYELGVSHREVMTLWRYQIFLKVVCRSTQAYIASTEGTSYIHFLKLISMRNKQRSTTLCRFKSDIQWITGVKKNSSLSYFHKRKGKKGWIRFTVATPKPLRFLWLLIGISSSLQNVRVPFLLLVNHKIHPLEVCSRFVFHHSVHEMG